VAARSLKFSPCLGLGLASGLLWILVFPKINLFPLSAVALVPLLLASAKESVPGRRFLQSTLSGCLFFAGTCYWIYGVMCNYGGLGVVASVGVFLLFFTVLGLYWGLFGTLAGYLWRANWGNVHWGPLAIPFLWVSLEYARSLLLSGFPWLLAGYALTDSFGLARVSRWTGVYGLSFLVVAWNVAAAWFIVRRSKWAGAHIAAVIAVSALLVATGAPETYSEDRKAYLVQTNIPEEVAFEPWSPSAQGPLLERLRALTEDEVGHQEQTSLVIWPETPAPFYFEEDSFTRQYAQSIARDTNSYFLLGIVGYVPGSGRSKPLNSTVLLAPDGSVVSQYDKIHLVPFGEYVPLKPWLGFADKLTAEVSDFVPGGRYVVSELPGGRMAGVICYEAIFPDLVRRFVKEGAEVLVNTSNDGWYGSSAARDQHLLMARMRAIENARYLLRATNTGITALVRPDGSIAKRLAPDQAGVLEARWAFQKQQTFYTRHGDVFAIAACLVTALALIAAWGASRRESEQRPDGGGGRNE
jgi:apolipoprotein N-acyltransferase